jgi:hypothetical protein
MRNFAHFTHLLHTQIFLQQLGIDNRKSDRQSTLTIKDKHPTTDN